MGYSDDEIDWINIGECKLKIIGVCFFVLKRIYGILLQKIFKKTAEIDGEVVRIKSARFVDSSKRSTGSIVRF